MPVGLPVEALKIMVTQIWTPVRGAGRNPSVLKVITRHNTTATFSPLHGDWHVCSENVDPIDECVKALKGFRSDRSILYEKLSARIQSEGGFMASSRIVCRLV
jgi:hypothetical protein